MKYDESFEHDSTKDWNMAVAFLIRLDRRLDEAQVSRAEGNLLKWYRILRSLFNQIHFKVKEKGNDKEEQDLILKLNTLKNKFTNSQLLASQQQLGVYSQTETELDDLERDLNDLLYEYGLVFGKSKKKTLEEELEDDFTGDE